VKKYLVTGGTGFIGSNLVRFLVDQKKEICLFLEKNSNFWRIKDLRDFVNTYEVDLTDFDKVKKLIKTIKPDVIFHLAAVGVDPSFNDLKKLFDINFYGTVNLLAACCDCGFECFINTGTSSEYGIKNGAMKENDELRPLVDYAISKACSSLYCLKEASLKKLPIYTVRPFNVYGDFESPHRLIPAIMVNFLLGKAVNLSSPKFVRDYIYVKDVVDFYMKLSEMKPKDFYIFNVGTGIQSSIEDVINIFQSVINKKLDINWGQTQPRPWEVECWYADMQRVKEVLRWYPQNNLKEGLKRSFDWFSKNFHLYKN